MKNDLWTGGWDSIFRVLDLVLNKKDKVQPYYVLDKDRPSAPFELKAMDIIKEMVSEIDPGAGKLVRTQAKSYAVTILPTPLWRLFNERRNNI